MDMTRREFCKGSAGLAGILAAGAAPSLYAAGANSRINVACIGFSDRFRHSLLPSFIAHKDRLNFDMVAVADLWRLRRDKAVKELSDKLDKSNFMEVYPKMKRQLLDRGLYGTPKLYTVMSITRAQDYGDERLLRSTIEDVAKVNRLLAEKMEEAARPGKDGSVDYGRITRLVARYAGEKDIKLPPSTVDEPIDSTEKQMEKILMELTRGNSLAVAVRLLKEENVSQIGKNNLNLGNK